MCASGSPNAATTLPLWSATRRGPSPGCVTIKELRARDQEIPRSHLQAHGDGLLAEFARVVDAVAVQREMAKRSAGVPGERRIEIRVGVNLGDAIVVATAINSNRTMIWSSPLIARIAAKFSLMLQTTNARSGGPHRRA